MGHWFSFEKTKGDIPRFKGRCIRGGVSLVKEGPQIRGVPRPVMFPDNREKLQVPYKAQSWTLCFWIHKSSHGTYCLWTRVLCQVERCHKVNWWCFNTCLRTWVVDGKKRKVFRKRNINFSLKKPASWYNKQVYKLSYLSWIPDAYTILYIRH